MSAAIICNMCARVVTTEQRLNERGDGYRDGAWIEVVEHAGPVVSYTHEIIDGRTSHLCSSCWSGITTGNFSRKIKELEGDRAALIDGIKQMWGFFANEFGDLQEHIDGECPCEETYDARCVSGAPFPPHHYLTGDAHIIVGREVERESAESRKEFLRRAEDIKIHSVSAMTRPTDEQ